MLCNEDYLQAIKWAESIGGLKKLIEKSEENLEVIEGFVEQNNWIHFLAKDKSIRSNTSVCLTLDLPSDKLKKMVRLLEEENVAYDISSYSEAPTGLRIWCGATVEKNDLLLLCQWLEWAYINISTISPNSTECKNID